MRLKGCLGLLPSVDFPSMPYFYDKGSEDVLFDLVQYQVISYPGPVSLSILPSEQFDSLRSRVCLKGIYLLTDANPDSLRQGSELFLSG